MSHIANTYLKRGCPFCFKFLLFLTESGLLDKVAIIEPDPESEEFESLRATLSEKLGKPATFPTVEIEPGKFMSDSEDLIQAYADKYGIDHSNMTTLPLYERGLFKRYGEMFLTTRAYREKYGDIDVKLPS